MDDRDFPAFCREVERLLTEQADAKGYGKDLYVLIQGMSAGSDAHALGEIVYKSVRYAQTGQSVDVLKIAAWAYLIWHHR